MVAVVTTLDLGSNEIKFSVTVEEEPSSISPFGAGETFI